MKPILIVSFLLVFTCAQAQTTSKQSDPQTWRRYTVAGEKFSVKLPTLPAMTTRKQLIYHLRKTQVMREIGVYADGVVYTINVYENVERLSLADFISKQNAHGRWDPATERPIVTNDLAGSEYKNKDNTLPATVRFFAGQGRLYQFFAGGAESDDEGVKQFFSSIALEPKGQGDQISDGVGTPFEPETPEDTVSSKEVDRKARLVMKPEPSYTEKARREQVTGTVVMKAVFSASGSVVNIEVLSHLPHGLTENAIEACRKIKFNPAVKNGRRVATKVQLEYNFNLF